MKFETMPIPQREPKTPEQKMHKYAQMAFSPEAYKTLEKVEAGKAAQEFLKMRKKMFEELKNFYTSPYMMAWKNVEKSFNPEIYEPVRRVIEQKLNEIEETISDVSGVDKMLKIIRIELEKKPRQEEKNRQAA
jgi:hypothetical protein